MIGTTCYIWHDNREHYDQVEWDPVTVTREEAYEIAIRKLSDDEHVTRVHVDFGERTFIEANRVRSVA